MNKINEDTKHIGKSGTLIEDKKLQGEIGMLPITELTYEDLAFTSRELFKLGLKPLYGNTAYYKVLIPINLLDAKDTPKLISLDALEMYPGMMIKNVEDLEPNTIKVIGNEDSIIVRF